MTFHLYDQNNDIYYYFKTGYKNIDDFYPVMDDPEFEKFMDWMETGPMDQKPFCGVHDFQGDTYTCGYGSYEIQDTIERFNSDGDYYLDEIYTQRFDNSKRLNTKEKREKTLKKVLSDEEQDK